MTTILIWSLIYFCYMHINVYYYYVHTYVGIMLYQFLSQVNGIVLKPKKLQAVEIFNKMMQCKEEKALIMIEAKNFLRWYHQKILSAISEDILSKYIGQKYPCFV